MKRFLRSISLSKKKEKAPTCAEDTGSRQLPGSRPSFLLDVQARLRVQAANKLASKTKFCLSFELGDEKLETSRKKPAPLVEWSEAIRFEVGEDLPSRLSCTVTRWESKRSFPMGRWEVRIEDVRQVLLFSVEDRVSCEGKQAVLDLSDGVNRGTCEIHAACEVCLSREAKELNRMKRRAFGQVEAAVMAMRVGKSNFLRCRAAAASLQTTARRRLRQVSAMRLSSSLQMLVQRQRYGSQLVGCEELKSKIRQLVVFLHRLSVIHEVAILQAQVRRMWSQLEHFYDMECIRVVQATLKRLVRRRRFVNIMRSLQIISPRVRLYVHKLTSRREARPPALVSPAAPAITSLGSPQCARILQAHVRRRIAMSRKLIPPLARMLVRSPPKSFAPSPPREQHIEMHGEWRRQSKEHMYQLQRECAKVIVAKIQARLTRRDYERAWRDFGALCWRLKAVAYRRKHVKRISQLISGGFSRSLVDQNRFSAPSLQPELSKGGSWSCGPEVRAIHSMGQGDLSSSITRGDLLDSARELLKETSQLLDREDTEEGERNVGEGERDRKNEDDMSRETLPNPSDYADDTRVYNVECKQKRPTTVTASKQEEWWPDYVNIVERWRNSNNGSSDEQDGTIGVSLLQTRKIGKRGAISYDFPRVQEILPGGAADVDGRIRVGDEVVAVDGTSTRNLHIEEVASMIAGRAGTEICLTIQRQEEEVDFRLLRYKYFRLKQAGRSTIPVRETLVDSGRLLDRNLWRPCLELEEKRSLLSAQDNKLLDQTLRIILEASETPG
ncbi:hypothetical protein GUITHDRAFT_113618 [Guillardia theta CCMP2712]|uniref:PDZ domain-containing protein n=1 Tax=Guillardia theta (strain CCMP2712) TaxID=905079 RepID=L1IVV0_GUITC|nr:hypothetical protein GUITHDRAFT_113618 [Guillardia theta CCMP2712]EKX40378.1 hypothetical protein GUITHDRAFT_113618 [Guillardia theta CCMP2712]|eukprot:XP_005827358.1 hypothetical protein GUITHDRAFT_113618 [Guillardia theta CCMP2712]